MAALRRDQAVTNCFSDELACRALEQFYKHSTGVDNELRYIFERPVVVYNTVRRQLPRRILQTAYDPQWLRKALHGVDGYYARHIYLALMAVDACQSGYQLQRHACMLAKKELVDLVYYPNDGLEEDDVERDLMDNRNFARLLASLLYNGIIATTDKRPPRRLGDIQQRQRNPCDWLFWLACCSLLVYLM